MLSKNKILSFCSFAGEIVADANRLIVVGFNESHNVEWKKDDSPVTIIDKIVNKTVIERIKEKYPKHGVLGEEQSDRRGDEDFLWVCDPIDGTLAFIAGMPTFVFSLSLLYKREVVLGIIHDPIQYTTYSASKFQSSKVDDAQGVRELRVSNNESFERAIFGICWWKGAAYDFSDLERKLVEADAKVLDAGSVLYMAAMVARGSMAGLFFPGTTAHDAAAAKIIVEQAGGKVTDVYGNDQYYDEPIKGFVASNGPIHDEMLRLIADKVRIKS